MRVPGSSTQLAMFEYSSDASSQIKDVDEGSSWLEGLAKPFILICFFGGTCYISYNSVKKKNFSKN